MNNGPYSKSPAQREAFDNNVGKAFTKVPPDPQARNIDLVNHAATSDGWHGYNLMVDPTSDLPKLTATHAQEFVVNLSRDKFLQHYLKRTSREFLCSQAKVLDRPAIMRCIA